MMKEPWPTYEGVEFPIELVDITVTYTSDPQERLNGVLLSKELGIAHYKFKTIDGYVPLQFVISVK